MNKPIFKSLSWSKFFRRKQAFCKTAQTDKTAHTEYYLPKVEIKDYDVKIDGKNVFDQPINNNTKTYENIRKIATGQGDD